MLGAVDALTQKHQLTDAQCNMVSVVALVKCGVSVDVAAQYMRNLPEMMRSSIHADAMVTGGNAMLARDRGARDAHYRILKASLRW